VDSYIAAEEFVDVVRFGVAAVFFWSAAMKMRRPFQFKEALLEYGIIRRNFAGICAVFVTGSELLIAIAYATGAQLASASLFASCILILFAVAVARVLRLGTTVRCSCFGSDELVSQQTLIRILALALAVFLVGMLSVLGMYDATAVHFDLPIIFSVGLFLLTGASMTRVQSIASLLKKCQECATRQAVVDSNRRHP
jgi:hypothetical protein